MLSGVRQEPASAAPRALQAPSQRPAIEVYTLGGFRVVVREHVLDERAWKRKPARQLFKILLSKPNRRVSREELLDLFWPASDPSAAATNFRSTLHALRTALKPAALPARLELICHDREFVWLRPGADLWVDADVLESAFERVRDAAEPTALLEQVSALYDGDYLPDDIYEDWADARRASLKQTWTELQIRLSHALDQAGDSDAAFLALQRLLRADPCDERAAQEAMQLLARRGRRREAIQIYQRLAEALAHELGVEPSDETQAVQRQVLAGHASQPALAEFRYSYPFPTPVDLIGREGELAILTQVLARGKVDGQAVLVGGSAGSGKSALVGRVVEAARAEGRLCLAGGCYEDRGVLPLGPFHDALMDFLLAQPAERIREDLGPTAAELAQAIPELRFHLGRGRGPDASDDGLAGADRIDRLRVFGAVYSCLRTLAERVPVLLCLEDLHAADEASVHLLHYLMRQTRRLPIVLLATFRSDEVQSGEPMAQLQAAVMRERLARRIMLDSLDLASTRELVTALLGAAASDGLVESLFTTTGGNPLFVEQLLLALDDRGQLVQRGGVWHGTTDLQGSPPVISEVIAARLLRLGPICREALAVGAVLGQTFESDVLLAALAPTTAADVLASLEQASRASIVRATSVGFGFRHALLREAVYWNLSAPRRMALHARVGELLERLRGSRAADYASELAYHFTRAGGSTPLRVKAVHYSMAAGRWAADLSSYPQALKHFEDAWGLMEHDAQITQSDVRLEAIESRAWAQVALGQWPASIENYRKVLKLSADPLHRATAHADIALTLGRMGDFAGRIAECEAGLAELAGLVGQAALRTRLQLQQLMGLTWYLQGRYRDVVRLGLDMADLVADAGEIADARILIYAHTVVAWGEMGQGHVDEALARYALVLEAAQRFGEKTGLATTYENIGAQNLFAGRLNVARDQLSQALGLYRDSSSELASLNAWQHLCRVWVAEGELDRAYEQLLQALDIAEEGRDRRAADIHQVLGSIHALRAQWTAAVTSFEQARAIRERVGDMAGRIDATVALGVVNRTVGELSNARAELAEACRLAELVDPSPAVVQAYREHALLSLLEGHVDAATTQLEHALSLAETMRETLEYAPTLLAMARLRALGGDAQAAGSFAERGFHRARTQACLIEAHIAMADAQRHSGDPRASVRHATQAVGLADRLGAPPLLAAAYLALAESRMHEDQRLAEPAFEAALQHATAAKAPFEQARVLAAFSECLATKRGQTERARRMAEQSRRLLDGLGVSL